MEFTPQEIAITVITIAVALIVIGFIFKTIFKLAVIASVCVLIFGFGFGWLPTQIESLREGANTGEVIVGETGEGVVIVGETGEGVVIVGETGEGVVNEVGERSLIVILDGIVAATTNPQTYEGI